jgi:PKHD-type hydroxylase
MLKHLVTFEELQETRDHDLDFRSVPAVFTELECENIINMAATVPVVESRITWGASAENVRDTDLFWIYCSNENLWLFKKIVGVINDVNRAVFGFSLDGHLYGFQLGRYRTGQGYDWHCDLGKQAPRRKLSVVVQLTDPKLYQGGGLEFFRTENERATSSRELGSVTIFPSFLLHRAARITDGERWSLVTWLEGAPFR